MNNLQLDNINGLQKLDNLQAEAISGGAYDVLLSDDIGGGDHVFGTAEGGGDIGDSGIATNIEANPDNRYLRIEGDIGGRIYQVDFLTEDGTRRRVAIDHGEQYDLQANNLRPEEGVTTFNVTPIGTTQKDLASVLSGPKFPPAGSGTTPVIGLSW